MTSEVAYNILSNFQVHPAAPCLLSQIYKFHKKKCHVSLSQISKS